MITRKHEILLLAYFLAILFALVTLLDIVYFLSLNILACLSSSFLSSLPVNVVKPQLRCFFGKLEKTDQISPLQHIINESDYVLK